MRFSADFCLLQPVDAAKSAGRLLMDVANRGRKLTVAMYNRGARMLEASTAIDPGDGFLFERGWTDGLPVVPPTRARIEAFLAHTDLPPETVLGIPDLRAPMSMR